MNIIVTNDDHAPMRVIAKTRIPHQPERVEEVARLERHGDSVATHSNSYRSIEIIKE